MIDTAFVEQRMRDVNPVSGVDDINAEELTRAVAAVAVTRAAAMQVPAKHPTPSTPTTPPLRRRKAWAFAAAFILILATIGIAALALRSNNPPVTDEPAPPTDVGSWQVTDVAEPRVHSIVDVASLPGGGFVVAVDHSEGSVLWSPDGIDWTEADPLGKVAATAPSELDQPPQLIAALADRVAVLDSGGPRVWVGDLATGAWDSISLDTAGLLGDSRAWAIASSDRQMLVVAKWSLVDFWDADEPAEDLADYVAWLIDPETGGVERHALPLDKSDLSLAAVWFEDRWVIAVGNVTAVTRDGMTWTLGGFVGLPDDPAWVTDLTAGPAGIVATTCRGWDGHPTFFSEDGLEWTRVPDQQQFPEQAQAGHAGAAYSDELGWVDFSQDGRSWSSIDAGVIDNRDPFNVAASGTSIFVQHEYGASLLTRE